MRPPLIWRLVNALRRYLENRGVPDAHFRQQMAAIWQAPVIRPTRRPVLNLTVYRLTHKRAA